MSLDTAPHNPRDAHPGNRLVRRTGTGREALDSQKALLAHYALSRQAEGDNRRAMTLPADGSRLRSNRVARGSRSRALRKGTGGGLE